MDARLSKPQADHPVPQLVQAEEAAAPGLNRAERRRAKHAARLRPRLISIDDGYRYVGVGRSKFYDDFLPRLKTVRVGRRNLIDLESLDRLIDELLAAE
jgi:hypothetical protein